MLPGRKYAPEDLLQILRQRVWLLLVPAAVISAITALYARQLPNRYASDATILVVPQRVPEDYVRSSVTTTLDARLQSITQQILSRARLERIVQDFNLYAEERRRWTMEDVVEWMRYEITAEVVQGDAFRVSFTGYEPRTVMQVTNRLASAFIEENLRDREVLVEGTGQFLEAQLVEARRRLIEQEKKLEAYRRQHSGELPEQVDANLQVIQNVQMQIQANAESLNRDRDRRLLIERQLGEAHREETTASSPGGASGTADTADVSTGTAAQQLAEARAALASLELRLKPEHPDIQQFKRVILDLAKKAESEALDVPVSIEGAPPDTSAETDRQRRIADLRLELAELDRQIADKQKEEKSLRDVVSYYEQRVDKAPTRESEMIELTRDYTTLQALYTSLLSKREESKITANLERRQIGEQFKLLDPARVAEKPVSPDRPRITLLGMFSGLALGLGLIALLEYRDGSFKTDDEITSVLGLPVLAIVPLMQSEGDRRRALRRRLLVGCGLGSTVVGCLATVVYTFIR